MPKQVTGYMTDDGQFFKTQEEAEYYQARIELLGYGQSSVYLANVAGKHIDDLVDFIENNHTAVKKFVDAVRGLKVGTENEQKPVTDEDKKGTT